jgi:hypothetical protein
MLCAEECQRVFCYNAVQNLDVKEGFEVKYVKRLVAPGRLYKNEIKEDWLCWDGKEYIEKEKKKE